MGLPHVLVRFYTNPDGRAARRTTVVVLALLGGFYSGPDAARGARPALHAAAAGQRGHGRRGAAAAPAALGSGWAGALLGALVAAGACGGVPVHVVRAGGEHGRGAVAPTCSRGRVRDFRLAAVVAGLCRCAGAVGGAAGLAVAVALVFAVAASTFCPLLVLGIWWRGLTGRGAVAGVLVGGVLSAVAVAAEPVRSVPERLARRAARPARDRHGAGRVPDDGRGQQDDRGRGAAGRRPGAAAAARPRAARARPRPGWRVTDSLRDPPSSSRARATDGRVGALRDGCTPPEWMSRRGAGTERELPEQPRGARADRARRTAGDDCTSRCRQARSSSSCAGGCGASCSR